MNNNKTSLILVKTQSNNNYLVDPDNKYIGLIPLQLVSEFNKHAAGKNNNYDNYYSKKAIFLKKNGLGNVKIKKSISITPKIIDYNLTNLRQILFEVTDSCNLKCKYCGYGELYNGYDKRQNKKMKLKQILPLFDYLEKKWERSFDISYCKPIIISFYGGEPLMNMNFIKDVVKYIKGRQVRNRLFYFSMTTNAMILDKHIDFLVENEFEILISLDGDRENQSYRVDIKGNNSFTKVISNIDLLYKTHFEYFKKYVNFNAVLHNKNSVSEIHEFIKNRYDKIPRISELSTNGIRTDKRKEYDMLFMNQEKSLAQSENYKKIENERFIAIKKYNNALITLHVYTPYIIKSYNDLVNSTNKKNLKYIPTGTCLPFSKKIFITVNGKILPCERIGQQFTLGMVKKNGVSLDFEKIASYYNNWLENVKKQCEICYRKESCTQCLFYLDGIEAKKGVCNAYVNQDNLRDQINSVMTFFEGHPRDYYRMMTEVIIPK